MYTPTFAGAVGETCATKKAPLCGCVVLLLLLRQEVNKITELRTARIPNEFLFIISDLNSKRF
jgi:hypothetical protein